MTAYDYEQFLAVDATGIPARFASFSAYAMSDTAFATPLPVFDAGGVPMASIDASSEGVVQPFKVEGELLVRLKSGAYIFPRLSAQGVLAQVIEAQTNAQTAQGAAQTAAGAALASQRAAEDAANTGTGSSSGSGVGNLVVLTWNGVGSQPARVYPAGHDQAGAVIPLPPEAYVRWRQPTFPTGVAVDGDEFRRVG